jgi:hypothetical protein
MSFTKLVRNVDTWLHHHHKRIGAIEKLTVVVYFVARALTHVPHWVMDVFHVLILVMVVPHLFVVMFLLAYNRFWPPISVPPVDTVGPAKVELRGESPTGWFAFSNADESFVYRFAKREDLAELCQVADETFAAITPLNHEERVAIYAKVIAIDPQSFLIAQSKSGNVIAAFTIASTFTQSAWESYLSGKFDYREVEPKDLAVGTGRSKYVYLGTAITKPSYRSAASAIGQRCAIIHAAVLTRTHQNDAVIFTSLSNRRLEPIAKFFGMTRVGENFAKWPIWQIDLANKSDNCQTQIANVRMTLKAVRRKPSLAHLFIEGHD